LPSTRQRHKCNFYSNKKVEEETRANNDDKFLHVKQFFLFTQFAAWDKKILSFLCLCHFSHFLSPSCDKIYFQTLMYVFKFIYMENKMYCWAINRRLTPLNWFENIIALKIRNLNLILKLSIFENWTYIIIEMFKYATKELRMRLSFISMVCFWKC